MQYNQDAINSLSNKVKGYGTEYDSSSNTIEGYGVSKNQFLLEYLYRESWACRRVVDYYPNKMIRGWGSLELEDDFKLIEETKEDFERLKKIYNEGQKAGNLYGDGYVIRFVDDGREITEPIDYSNVREIKYSRIFDNREVQPHYEVQQVDYYNPEFYHFYYTQLNPYNLVHKDRIIRFKGDFLPPESFVQNTYSYASVLEPFITPYFRLTQSLGHIAEALTSFEVILFGVRDLFDDLMNGDQTQRDQLKQRYKLAQQQMSSMRGMVHDMDDETVQIAERKFNSISSLIEDVFRKELIAASGLSKTQLYNEHPSGMNSTGKSELLVNANKVLELQEVKWRELIDIDTKLIMAKYGIEDGYRWSWESTYQPTKEEEVINKRSIAETDRIYIESGVLSAEEVRQRFIGSEYQESLVVEENMVESKDNSKEKQSDRQDVIDRFIPEGNIIETSDYVPLDLETLQTIEEEQDAIEEEQ